VHCVVLKRKLLASVLYLYSTQLLGKTGQDMVSTSRDTEGQLCSNKIDLILDGDPEVCGEDSDETYEEEDNWQNNL
jgi:hypothetical protein